tara:strand:- start:429 stop:902 length:474 start_codon:yes stop_codon:yes gene_type:complete
MRILVPGVISKDEARELIESSATRSSKFENLVIKKVVEKVKQLAPVITEKPSYWSVECRPQGHKPHFDGCRSGLKPNHMPWCQYSAVVLLSNPDSFDGGVFSFFDPEESHKEDLYLSLLLYSSGAGNDPQKHQASAHMGGLRQVLIMFFATENSRDL